MPERSSVAQVSQIGVEATPGLAVAATRRLGSLTISPSIQAEAEMFRPAGLKFPTVQVLNREWAEVDVEGQPTYEEVVVPLSGAIDTATVSEVMDGATATGAYEWVFTPDSGAADNPKTFTLEQGQDGVQAERFTHLLFTGFGLEVSRTAATMSGGGFAQAAEAGFDMTNGLETPEELTPIAPGQFCVYLGDTPADLDLPANRLTRVISANPTVEDRYNPAWFVNCTEDSFSAFVENPDGVGGTFGLTVEADDAGMAWLPRMRAGTTHYLRLEANGPVIYNAGEQPDLRMMFRWDFAVKVETADTWSDEDGIYAIPWTLRPVHDGTWGKAMEITVRNTVAAL